MDLPTAFNAALICIVIYIWLQGGWVGRVGAVLVLSASAITYIGMGGQRPFGSLNIVIFAGDVLLLVGFIYLAIVSSRWWPIWASALQLNGVCSHLVAWLAPTVVSQVYYRMTTAWGVPILIVMATGTALDQRAAKMKNMNRDIVDDDDDRSAGDVVRES